VTEVLINQGRIRILADGEVAEWLTQDWFAPEWWKHEGLVLKSLGGRGQAVLLDSSVGHLVLRRFLRGGWVSRLSEDAYLNLGIHRSRAFREFRLLKTLRRLQLPVPEPVAASFEPNGLTYKAGLLTRFIPDASELAELAPQLSIAQWSDLASTLEDFFSAGLSHPDLNARNLLLDRSGQWHLLDLDRAVLRGREVDGRAMCRRLARSLEKLCLSGWRQGFDASLGRFC
jgi:3-deoxy-D-manno-octulosonic acid kinase